MTANNTRKADVTAPFAQYLKGFNVKLGGGAKPATANFEAVAELGVRGVKVGMALAMYLRPQGATNSEVVAVVGAPQRVLMAQLIKAGKLVPVEVEPRNGFQVYAVRLATEADRKPRKAGKAKAGAKAKAAPKVEAAGIDPNGPNTGTAELA